MYIYTLYPNIIITITYYRKQSAAAREPPTGASLETPASRPIGPRKPAKLRLVHLLRAFLLRVFESDFPGDPL